MAFPNRYPGCCASCRVKVPVGAGTVEKRDGKWITFCAAHAPAGAPSTPHIEDTRREIAADGTIHVPYSKDESQKALLRSLPPPQGMKSAWDADKKLWRSSVSRANIARTLDVARRLGLTIAPELLALESCQTAETQAAASIPGLYPFQVVGVQFLSTADRRLLADDQGCIDGDAVVNLSRAGKGFSVKLSELYRRFTAREQSHGRAWDPGIPTYIRSVCNGELRLNRIVKVFDKGVRPVVRLTLKSGKSLRLTADHEVMTGWSAPGADASVWVPAADLEPGMQVATNGTPVCKLCGGTEGVATYVYAKFPGVCRKCMYRQKRAKPTWRGGRYADKSGYILVSGQWNHPAVNAQGSVREHVLVMERQLGRYFAADERVHHRDGNKSNNAIENLELMTVGSHAAAHGRQGGYRRLHGSVSGRGGSVCFVPKADTVVSVVPDGEAHVYDVVCEDPHRNFVANGIVVHNCGKTIEALCALPRAGELPPVMVICPAVVKYNWTAEAAKWSPMYTTEVLSGRGSFRWPRAGEVLAVNYDLLPAACSMPAHDAEDDKKQEYETFKATAPQGLILIVDETHNCRNRSARMTKVLGLSACAARVWGLTGTPLMNRPVQLWHVLQALRLEKDVFGSWMTFVRCFQGEKNRWGGWEWGDPLPEVPERMRRVMLRRTKAEVLPDLPPKTRQSITVNGVSAGLRKQMDEAWEKFADELAEGNLPPFEEFSAMREALARERLEAAIEWLEPYEDAGEPVVVMSAHRFVTDELAKREGWATITGDTPSQRRQEIVQRFQNGELKGVACTIQAAGVGITLTRARTMLFVDLDWTPANNLQAEDRIHRIGQHADKVLYVTMVSNHVLDQHVHKLLSKKMRMIELAIERLVKIDVQSLQAEAESRKVQAARSQSAAAAEQHRWELTQAAAREAEKTEARERCAAIKAGRRARYQGAELELTPERVTAVKQALDAMLAVCDGAEALDGMGFNKPDAVSSRWFACLGLDDAETQGAALAMLQGYRRQLGDRFPILWRDGVEAK